MSDLGMLSPQTGHPVTRTFLLGVSSLVLGRSLSGGFSSWWVYFKPLWRTSRRLRLKTDWLLLGEITVRVVVRARTQWRAGTSSGVCTWGSAHWWLVCPEKKMGPFMHICMYQVHTWIFYSKAKTTVIYVNRHKSFTSINFYFVQGRNKDFRKVFIWKKIYSILLH